MRTMKKKRERTRLSLLLVEECLAIGYDEVDFTSLFVITDIEVIPLIPVPAVGFFGSFLGRVNANVSANILH